MFVPRVFADDARIFLSSGGFARTAPDPDTPEFRIAVEDLKARFAACAWHDPIDPNRVLGKEVAQASAEWQQEITSQATQRQQVLSASATSTKALQEGAFALGRMLGQSWIADYATRWLDHYTEGGINWIGDGQLEIQVPGAAGKCLDVQGGKKDNGTPVQVYTCNGGASQKWAADGLLPRRLHPGRSELLQVPRGAERQQRRRHEDPDPGLRERQGPAVEVRRAQRRDAAQRGDRQVPAPADVRQRQGRRAVDVRRLRRAEDDWPGNGPWYKKFEAYLSSGSTTKISFNLDGITDPAAAARAGKTVDPTGFEGLTNWELYKISQSPQAWDRITWYKGGRVDANPFK